MRTKATMPLHESCFACGKRLQAKHALVKTIDNQQVFVGRDCFLKVVLAGRTGYQPPKGGPRLYTLGVTHEAPTT